MTHTREYFRINRQKARINNRLKRDRLNKRYRQVFQIGQPVYVTKPSFTRKEGVKGLSKIVGHFRGPYQIVGVDSHNGVDIEIDGEVHHFNVSQVVDTDTLYPLDRQPPAYQEDRLVYQPELEKGKLVEGEEKHTTDSILGDALDTEASGEISEEKKVPDKEVELQSLPLKHKFARGEDKEISTKRNFQIVFDKVEGIFYAGELLDDESEQTQAAALFRTAKKGLYHNIWYDPNDANKTKTQKTCPKGYKPWTIPLDDTWDRIGPIVHKLSDLTRRIITRQSLDPI